MIDSLSPEQVRSLRGSLMDRARALGAQVRAVEDERAEDLERAASDTVEDLGDQGEHLTRDAVRQAESGRDAAELRAIDAALQRMAEGRYGICEDCGIEIALRRLLVQPAAARCIECQERREQSRPGGAPDPLAFS